MDLQVPKTNLHDILNDPTIPVWKKDLIVRKRNTNRLLFGNLKYTCASTGSSSTTSIINTPTSSAIRSISDDECSAGGSNLPTASNNEGGNSSTSAAVAVASCSDVDTVKSSSVEDFHLVKNNVTLNTPQSNGEQVEGTSSTAANNDSSSCSSVCVGNSSKAEVFLTSNEMRLNDNLTSSSNTIINGNSSENNSSIINSNNNHNKKVKSKKRNSNLKISEEKIKMKNSTRKLSVPNSSSTTTTTKELTSLLDSEEIKYGPGIVHKLRDRYINITLREAASNYNKRPPLSSLRRASSLDNILDDAPRRGSNETTAPPAININVSRPAVPTKYIKKSDKQLSINKQESLKRVRSMETLLSFDGKPSTPLLVNDDIVIIEQTKPVVPVTRKRTSSGSIPSEDELPPPDVVRQTRQKFERRTVSSSGLVSSRVNNFKKPALSPKPAGYETPPKSPIQKENQPSPKIMMPIPPPLPLPVHKFPTEKKSPIKLSPTVEKVPLLLSPVTSPVEKTPPKIQTLPKSVPTKPPSPSLIPKMTPKQKSPSPPRIVSPTTNGKDKIDFGDEKDDTLEENTKIISQKALENIRRNGFSFEISPRTSPNPSHLPGSRSPSPQVISVQQKSNDKTNGDISQKQVGVIRPIPKTTTPNIENNRSNVNEKNLINNVKSEKPNNNIINNTTLKTDKSIPNQFSSPPNFAKPVPKVETPVLRPVPSPSPPNVLVVVKPTEPSTELWGAKKLHYNDQPATQTFDFTKSTKPVPKHIENDGVIHRNSAGEDVLDLGPPTPFKHVEVIGGNVLINGRSNLQKIPKANKMKIKFDDGATSTFEYPSEASLLLDDGLPTAGPSTGSSGEQAQQPRAALQPLPSGSGSLASYTPSKILMSDDTFELGVTRAAAATAPVLLLGGLDEESSDFLLKPAEDGDTVAWSSETASDLLF